MLKQLFETSHTFQYSLWEGYYAFLAILSIITTLFSILRALISLTHQSCLKRHRERCL
jgi:hypothetical protein